MLLQRVASLWFDWHRQAQDANPFCHVSFAHDEGEKNQNDSSREAYRLNIAMMPDDKWHASGSNRLDFCERRCDCADYRNEKHKVFGVQVGFEMPSEIRLRPTTMSSLFIWVTVIVFKWLKKLCIAGLICDFPSVYLSLWKRRGGKDVPIIKVVMQTNNCWQRDSSNADETQKPLRLNVTVYEDQKLADADDSSLMAESRRWESSWFFFFLMCHLLLFTNGYLWVSREIMCWLCHSLTL